MGRVVLNNDKTKRRFYLIGAKQRKRIHCLHQLTYRCFFLAIFRSGTFCKITSMDAKHTLQSVTHVNFTLECVWGVPACQRA